MQQISELSPSHRLGNRAQRSKTRASGRWDQDVDWSWRFISKENYSPLSPDEGRKQKGALPSGDQTQEHCHWHRGFPLWPLPWWWSHPRPCRWPGWSVCTQGLSGENRRVEGHCEFGLRGPSECAPRGTALGVWEGFSLSQCSLEPWTHDHPPPGGRWRDCGYAYVSWACWGWSLSIISDEGLRQKASFEQGFGQRY